VLRAVIGLPGIVDTQCGFKFFRRHAALNLFGRQRIDGYMFDVEILYLAQRAGYRIAQVPVRWRDDGDSRLPLLRGNLQNMIDVCSSRCSPLMIMMNAASSKTAVSRKPSNSGSLGPPPQKTDRAVRVHVLFTLLLFALATAYRLQREHEDSGGELVGWQGWRRQLLERTRDHVIIFAQGCYGIFHRAEYALLLGVKLNDVPPGISTLRELPAKYGLVAQS
jgi:hypothetical protein